MPHPNLNPLDTVKGFGVTFKQIFKKPITQQYPEYKRPVYPRFRGRHRLHVHENGLEKCVGCSLCAAACPADCIRVVAAENTAGVKEVHDHLCFVDTWSGFYVESPEDVKVAS